MSRTTPDGPMMGESMVQKIPMKAMRPGLGKMVPMGKDMLRKGLRVGMIGMAGGPAAMAIARKVRKAIRKNY